MTTPPVRPRSVGQNTYPILSEVAQPPTCPHPLHIPTIRGTLTASLRINPQLEEIIMSDEQGWFYVRNGETVGPISLSQLVDAIPTVDGPNTLIYGPGHSDWTEARHVHAIASRLTHQHAPPKPPKRRVADEIDYEIHGEDMQFVEVTLDPEEVVIAEAGAMMYMTDGIRMRTVFGDASRETGFLGKLAAAGKRMITGESLFLTTFGAESARQEQVAFGAPYPGQIIPMHIDELGGELICQKDSFLCAARGVEIGIAFQKRIGAALFGGEGFIMQRIRGDGIAFVHAGGAIQKRELEAGETLRLDTGCLVALQPSVRYDIERAGGIKTMMFGGEGIFVATLTGPGTVWLQSLPFSRLAGRIAGQFARGRGEGSVLGGVANLFEQ